MNKGMRRAWRAGAAVIAALLAVGLATFALTAAKSPAPESVKAAIVNLDAGTELQGQFVPMGRQLSAELVLQESQFDWEMSTPELAEDGLIDGDYRAVVTIPERFSEEVTSLASSMDSGGQVVQAQIEVQTGPGASQDQADALELVTRAATSSLGGQLSSEVVAGLIGGFGEMGTQLGQAANGAHQLADGVNQLADGTGELADGAGQLADGAHQAADGVNELASGADQLATGANQAASGVSQLADGTAGLASGAGQAASGVGQLANGMSGLATGAGQAASGVQQLANGTGALVGGLGQSATGAQALAGGAGELAGGASQLADGAGELADGVGQYVDGVAQLAGGAEQLADGVTEMSSQMDAAISGVGSGISEIGTQIGAEIQAFLDANDISGAVQQVAEAAATMGAYCLANPNDRACEGLSPEQWQEIAGPDFAQQLLNYINALPATIPGQADEVANQLVGQVEQLLAPVHQLADGTRELANGADQLATNGRDLADGAQEYAAGVGSFAVGANDLANGTGALANGLSQAAKESAALVAGANQAADGIGALAGGANALANGTSQAAGGINELASGANQLASGANQAADGVSTLAGGVGQLADGAGQAGAGIGTLAEGMGELSEGTTALGNGAAELGGGATTLADGLSTAVDMIPSYTEAQAQDMALGVTQPIIPPTVASGVSALGAAAMALLLWLFSFFVAWVFPIFSPRVGRSVQSSWRLAFSTWWKPAAWSAGMGVIAGAALGAWANTSFGSVFALAGIGLFAGVIFSGVQQALAASLGAVGRVLSLAIFGVGLLATAPSLWGSGIVGLAQILPVGLATKLLNSVIVPGAPSAGFAAVGLLLWTGLAYFVAIWATSRKRSQPTIAPGSVPA